MSLDLFVWGPAFGLASGHAECLAAISYCKQTLDQDEWNVIASNGYESAVALHHRPTLKHKGNLVACGFDAIVKYLSHKQNIKANEASTVDFCPNHDDIEAYTAHLQHAFSPLLDIAFYVSPTNYHNITRPSYSPFLSFPIQYHIPPAHRARAQRRAAIFGITSADMDNISSSRSDWQKSMSSLSSRSLSSSLQQSVNSTRFRFDAMIDEACAPLEELVQSRASKRQAGLSFLFNDKIASSLDCLLSSYVLIALVDLPEGSLRETMRQKYPYLCSFAAICCEKLYGREPIVPEHALQLADHNGSSSGPLPWKMAPEKTISGKIGYLCENMLQAYLPTQRSSASQSDQSYWKSKDQTSPEDAALAPVPPAHQQQSIQSRSSVLAGSILLLGTASFLYSLYFPGSTFFPRIFQPWYSLTSFLTSWSRPRSESSERKLDEMGEAGILLGGLEYGG